MDTDDLDGVSGRWQLLDNVTIILQSENSTTESPDLYDIYAAGREVLNFQFYAWAVVGTIVAIFGILGNVLSIIVLSNKRMMSSTSCYLIALAIFDTIVLISLVLFFSLPTIRKLESYLRIYPYFHPFAYPIALISQTCSIYTTVGFTVERYIAVCHPLKAAKMCTISRARKAVLFILLASVIYNIPRMLEHRLVHEWDPINNVTTVHTRTTALGENTTFRHVYFLYMHMCVMLIVPFAVLAVLNLMLIRAVKQSEKTQGRITNRTRRENNLTVMLISVVVVFLLCQVPSIIDNVFTATLSVELHNTPPFIKLYCIGTLMVILNSAINFYLYCVFGQKFRRVFCRIFCVYYLKATSTLLEQDTLLLHSTSGRQNKMSLAQRKGVQNSTRSCVRHNVTSPPLSTQRNLRQNDVNSEKATMVSSHNGKITVSPDCNRVSQETQL